MPEGPSEAAVSGMVGECRLGCEPCSPLPPGSRAGFLKVRLSFSSLVESEPPAVSGSHTFASGAQLPCRPALGFRCLVPGAATSSPPRWVPWCTCCMPPPACFPGKSRGGLTAVLGLMRPGEVSGAAWPGEGAPSPPPRTVCVSRGTSPSSHSLALWWPRSHVHASHVCVCGCGWAGSCPLGREGGRKTPKQCPQIQT